jgi:Mrp family chromosome partitioning ATPase
VQEQFEPAMLRLAASVALNRAQRGLQAVMVSSARAGRGVTSTTLLLAQHLQNAYSIRTLAVEANRYRPALASMFNLEPGRDLDAIVENKLPVAACVQQAKGIAIIPCSPIPADTPLGPSICSVLQRIASWSAKEYDMLLADMPSVLEYTDVPASANAIPHLLLVVRSGQCSYDDLDRVRQVLTAAQIEIAGSILIGERRVMPGWLEKLLVG